MFLLVDCNSFYASCERVFQPKLNDKPVIVLSNNDGCIVARSNEAKALGIPMGVPFFQIRDIIRKNKVAVFSSNYALYGDMSERVMNVLQSHCPDMEVYSIDEAFLKYTFPINDAATIDKFGHLLRTEVKQYTGIPVSVGIAPTKTLAKLANHIAKKPNSYALLLPPDCFGMCHQYNGVFSLADATQHEVIMSKIPVSEVWGIGRAHQKRLEMYGITNVWALRNASESWIRQEMGVVGVRLVKELKGFPCHDLEPPETDRQNMCVSRAFQKDIENVGDLKEAIATYATKMGEKLRHFNQKTSVITVFLVRNRFKANFTEGGYAYSTKTIELLMPTSDTAKIIASATQIIEEIHQKGLAYKKAGIMASALISDKTLQADIFGEAETERKRESLMHIMDGINARMGKNTVRFSTCASKSFSNWQMKSAFRSPRYTTMWREILAI